MVRHVHLHCLVPGGAPRPGEILFDPACGTSGFLTCAILHMRDRHVKGPEDEQALQAGLRAVEKKQLPYMLRVTNLLFFEKGEPTREVWFYEHRVPEGQKAYSMTKPIRVEHLQGCVDWWGGRERQGREQTEQAWRVSLDETTTLTSRTPTPSPTTTAIPKSCWPSSKPPRPRPQACATN